MSARTKLEQWTITRPIVYAPNARVCPEEAIAKVAGSIREFGFRSPILVDFGWRHHRRPHKPCRGAAPGTRDGAGEKIPWDLQRELLDDLGELGVDSAEISLETGSEGYRAEILTVLEIIGGAPGGRTLD